MCSVRICLRTKNSSQRRPSNVHLRKIQWILKNQYLKARSSFCFRLVTDYLNSAYHVRKLLIFNSMPYWNKLAADISITIWKTFTSSNYRVMCANILVTLYKITSHPFSNGKSLKFKCITNPASFETLHSVQILGIYLNSKNTKILKIPASLIDSAVNTAVVNRWSTAPRLRSLKL